MYDHPPSTEKPSKKSRLRVHLIPNSHLDPVWLWDWREGLTEGLITVRTILDLMDEDSALTYIRGESAIYRYIEETEPATFRRILRHAKSGRWDVVGGTVIQPDTNLPATESLARHFTRGLAYFRSRFGRAPRAAWQADSFGHTAGLPELFREAGMDSFMFTRPSQQAFRLSEPAFWWEGAAGARILAYRPLTGGYTSERDDIPKKLDALVQAAAESRLATVACPIGLGDHGGGPTRRHLSDIRAWAGAHPETEVIFSGLHRFFAALRAELAGADPDFIPSHRGEIQHCFRGCYSSVAKFKFAYRQTENLLLRAETTGAAISALTRRPAGALNRAWEGLLFNTFHDVLPGSSIERAFDDQLAWIGGVRHTAQSAELRALTTLAERVGTKSPRPAGDHPADSTVLVWNPHPHPFIGPVEVEFSVDYRPIWSYRDRADQLPLRVLGPHGKPLAFQEIAREHGALPNLPWRKRIVAPLRLPPLGWTVLHLGWHEGARPPAVPNAVQAGPGWIANEHYRFEARVGDRGVRLLHRDRPVFGAEGFSAVVVEDPWGSWGNMADDDRDERPPALREVWTVAAVETLETGPERAQLWVRLSGARSRIDLSVALSRGREAVDVAARVLWDERAARLKFRFPTGAGEAEFEVPGASQVRRQGCGETPGGRWVRVGPATAEGFGFASDAVYGFDWTEGQFGATIARATRYADDRPLPGDQEPWRPAVDSGELRFRFALAPGSADLGALAAELERPPIAALIPPRAGPLPPAGSVLRVMPSSLRLLALKPADAGSGFILRLQATAGQAVQARIRWCGQALALGRMAAGRIASWRLVRTRGRWTAQPVDLAERPGRASRRGRRASGPTRLRQSGT